MSDLITEKFFNKDGFEFETHYKNRLVLTQYNGFESVVTIPGEKIDGKKVDEISYSAFAGQSNIVQINIPNSVTIIDSSAFYNCKKLVYFNMPEFVRRIGDNAFSCCESLKRISLPSFMPVIEEGVFYNCKNLEEVVVPASVDRVRAFSFMNCDKLKTATILGFPVMDSIAFPEKTKLVYAEKTPFFFYGLPERIDVYKTPNDVIYHESGRYTLEFLHIEDKDQAFWKDVDNTYFTGDFKTIFSYSPDNEAKEYVIPKHVEFIEDCAFLDNPYIEKIHLHENVQQAGKYAIANCPNMDQELTKAINNKKAKQNDCDLQL